MLLSCTRSYSIVLYYHHKIVTCQCCPRVMKVLCTPCALSVWEGIPYPTSKCRYVDERAEIPHPLQLWVNTQIWHYGKRSFCYKLIQLFWVACFIVSHRIMMLLDWIQVNDSAHLSSVGFQVLAAT